MKLCPLNGTRIPIHIRSIMTFESKFESGQHAIMLEAAAEHVNNMAGILDEYQICFQWNHARVSHEIVIKLCYPLFSLSKLYTFMKVY